MIRICVFCGSQMGRTAGYREAARGFGALLAERGLGLVYGGGRVGLMGVLADAVLAGGGLAWGVIPRSLDEREVAHATLTELEVVTSMHERKARMADLSDAFVALPGGLGTLDEWFEIWTWAQLGIHRKPLGMLNVEGYFDPLLAFLDRTVTEGFVHLEHRARAAVDDDPARLLDRLLAKLPD